MMYVLMSSFGDAGLVGRGRVVESNQCAPLGGETKSPPCDGVKMINVSSQPCS